MGPTPFCHRSFLLRRLGVLRFLFILFLLLHLPRQHRLPFSCTFLEPSVAHTRAIRKVHDTVQHILGKIETEAKYMRPQSRRNIAVHNKSAADQGSPIRTVEWAVSAFSRDRFCPPFEPGRLVMLMPADLDLFASAQRDIARESSFLFAMFFIFLPLSSSLRIAKCRAAGDKVDARHSARS